MSSTWPAPPLIVTSSPAAGRAPRLQLPSVNQSPSPAAPVQEMGAAAAPPHVRDLGHTMIFGPTGSGKSTLLRCINALVPVTRGSIAVDGVEVNDPRLDTLALRRIRAGIVRVHYAITIGVRRGRRRGRAEPAPGRAGQTVARGPRLVPGGAGQRQRRERKRQRRNDQQVEQKQQGER